MKITVLMHEKDPPLSFYALGYVCDVWRSQGHEVKELHGLSRPIDGDIVFLHVDLTVVPDVYLRAVADLPRVVNRRVADISKTRISRIQVHSPGEYDGPVIVKTVRNHGGQPERRSRRGTVFGRLWNGVGKLMGLSLGVSDYLNPHFYPVFDSAREVPSRVFRNRALMVERFVPERRGELYCMRTCSFLGDAIRTRMGCSSHLTVTLAHPVDWQEVPMHPAVVALRRELGFDFGRFDYVVHDGHLILLDANRTPGALPDLDRERQRAAILAPGLEALLC